MVYRVLPSSSHRSFEPRQQGENEADERWDPFDIDESVDWVQGLRLVAGAGSAAMKSGIGVFIFAAIKDMDPFDSFYSADGDMLIVP